MCFAKAKMPTHFSHCEPGFIPASSRKQLLLSNCLSHPLSPHPSRLFRFSTWEIHCCWHGFEAPCLMPLPRRMAAMNTLQMGHFMPILAFPATSNRNLMKYRSLHPSWSKGCSPDAAGDQRYPFLPLLSLSPLSLPEQMSELLPSPVMMSLPHPYLMSGVYI